MQMNQPKIPSPNKLQLTVNTDRNDITLTNCTVGLEYLILSSEPGRTVNYPPQDINEGLVFGYDRIEGISEQNESFCAVGLSLNLKHVMQKFERRAHNLQNLKTLYFTKIIVRIRTLDFSQRLSASTKEVRLSGVSKGKPLSQTLASQSLIQESRRSFTALVMPPEEIDAIQIQEFLELVIKEYGNIEKVDAKRNCLMITFQSLVGIKQGFYIKKPHRSKNESIYLTYWAVTSHRTLFTYEPSMLIELPSDVRIKKFVINSEWLVIATDEDVVFLHLYKPGHLFLTLKGLKVHALSCIDQERVILFEYKFFYIYQLFTHKNPVLLGKAKTRKIVPYTVAFRKKAALFAGINYSSLMNSPVQEKEIYVVENFSPFNISSKHFTPDKCLQLCKKNQDVPVKNLTYLAASDLFMCSCAQSIYLFHLDSGSLIASVDLSSHVKKLYQIEYPINFVNCLVSAKGEHNLIRVSFEQYGQIVGTEVNSVPKYADCVDFSAKGKEVYLTDGGMILLSGASNNSRVLYSRQSDYDQIGKIEVKDQFLAFVVEKQNFNRIYFLQM